MCSPSGMRVFSAPLCSHLRDSEPAPGPPEWPLSFLQPPTSLRAPPAPHLPPCSPAPHFPLCSPKLPLCSPCPPHPTVLPCPLPPSVLPAPHLCLCSPAPHFPPCSLPPTVLPVPLTSLGAPRPPPPSMLPCPPRPSSASLPFVTLCKCAFPGIVHAGIPWYIRLVGPGAPYPSVTSLRDSPAAVPTSSRLSRPLGVSRPLSRASPGCSPVSQLVNMWAVSRWGLFQVTLL